MPRHTRMASPPSSAHEGRPANSDPRWVWVAARTTAGLLVVVVAGALAFLVALVVIGVARGSSPEPVEVDSAGAAVMVGLFGLALLTPFIALVVVDVVLAVSRNRAVLVWHAVVGGVGFVATLGAVADHPWLLLVFVAFAAVACFGIAGFAATTPRARRARIVPAVRAR